MFFKILLLLGIFSSFEAMVPISHYGAIVYTGKKDKPTCMDCFGNKETAKYFELKNAKIIKRLKSNGVISQSFNLDNNDHWEIRFDYEIRRQKAEKALSNISALLTQLDKIPSIIDRDKATNLFKQHYRNDNLAKYIVNDPSVEQFINEMFSSCIKSNQSGTGSGNMKNAFKLIWSDVRNITTFLCLAYFFTPKLVASCCRIEDVFGLVILPYFIFTFYSTKSNAVYQLVCCLIALSSGLLALSLQSAYRS